MAAFNQLTDSFDPGCCYYCLQVYGQVDRDIESGATIVWQHETKDSDGSVCGRLGHVCRACFTAKRKYEPKVSMQELVVSIHTDAAKRAK